MEWTRDGYTISTDPDHLDRRVVHEFLVGSYWAKGIPREVVDRSIENSMPFGVYEGDDLVGFARVITDKATFAYLSDVFIVDAHRGRGLSKWLMEIILAHPDLQNLRRWSLTTRDAHGLYGQFGFTALAKPERHMEMLDADVYERGSPKPKAQSPNGPGQA